MTSKYRWDFQETHLDRSMPSGRRVTTDAGNPRPRITPQVTRADLDRRDNPADRSQGLRPGEPEVQTQDDAEVQRFIDRALSGEFDRRADARLSERLRNERADETPDRRYLAFPEAHSAVDRNPDEARAVAELMAGPQISGTVTNIIADFTRSILIDPKRAWEHAKNPISKRALSEGTPGEGGYLVPPGFIPQLLGVISPYTNLYSLCTRIPVTQLSGKIPRLTVEPTITYGSENTEMTSGDPAFDEVEYTITRRNAITKMSREIVDDSPMSIVQMVQRLITDSLNAERELSVAYGAGSGSGRPEGIYQSSGITDVSGITSVNYANLLTLFETVDQRWQDDPSFVWTFNQRVRKAISGILDENHRPIFTNDATTAFKPMLFGKPVVICNALPPTFIFCGAMRHYAIFDRQLTTMDSTTEAGDAFVKHMLWLKLTERVDGKWVGPVTSVAAARSKILTGT